MSRKVVTGKVRLSYVHVFERNSPKNGEKEGKYDVTILLKKSDTQTMSKIQEAIAEAREEFCKRNGANALPLKPKTTIHDGDGQRESGEPYGPECKDCWVFTASSKKQPIVVDRAGNEILDAAEVYSGCYGRVSINFFGYNSNGKKGISAGLLGVQKLCDGEPFGTYGSAEDFNDGYSDDDEDDFAN